MNPDSKPVRSQVSWLSGLAAAALLYAVAFWRVPFIWFRADDFAWLQQGRIAREFGLTEALFSPGAQGTIRFLSERLYFLILGEAFGITSWPFRLAAIGTWLVALWLIQEIGSRLIASRAAGLTAAFLWGISPRLFTPLAWASAYNELLLTVLVLGAFYARLRWLETNHRGWRWLEAGLFLTGFGVLELVVLYPAAMLLHALFSDAVDDKTSKRWTSTLWMWVPAVGFTLLHLFVIPKVDDPAYQLIIDSRLPGTLWTYISWTVGRNWINLYSGAPVLSIFVQQSALNILAWGSGIVLAAFAVWMLLHKRWLPLLFLGWFVLWLLPVLPLANHLTEYYLTIPSIGIAWLAGWAVARAFAANIGMRVAACVLLLGYLGGALAEIDALSAFHLEMTGRMRLLFRSTEATLAKYPNSALLFLGINDETWFRAGFGSSPMRLAGTERAYLPPKSRELEAFADFDGVPQFQSAAAELVHLRDAGQLRVLEYSQDRVRDVTSAYDPVLRAQFSAELTGPVNIGYPAAAEQLGDGWHDIENGTRWSEGRASLQLWARAGVATLHVTGYASQSVFDALPQSGPIKVEFFLKDRSAGSAQVDAPGEFTFVLPLADALIEESNAGSGYVDLVFTVSHTFQPPGDGRELGLIFGTFELR